MSDRIIVLLDMDCFYVQVEERDHHYIKGNPAAVVQYNTWKGGGIIAVNYEARAYGVKRGMRGDEAKEKCPSIHLITVPVQRGKANITKYRRAGSEVISALSEFSDSVERASIDEAYIDFTKTVNEKFISASNRIERTDLSSTWVVGYERRLETATSDSDDSDTRSKSLSSWLDTVYDESDSSVLSVIAKDCDQKLAIAAVICEEMRAAVLRLTGFKCSAGISHNKVLAKLACGLHKPNQQTVLPMNSVAGLWSELPVSKVRNLGGKLGDSLTEDFKCKTMGDLAELSLAQLKTRLDEKTALWLLALSKGIDNEPVKARLLPKSIGCGKNFLGRESLSTKEKVHTWMQSLTDELSERLEEDRNRNHRYAKTLTVHMRLGVEGCSAFSRSCSLPSYESAVIARTALSLIKHTNTKPKTDQWFPAVTHISLSAGKFEKLISGNVNIKDHFLAASTSGAGQSVVTKSVDMEDSKDEDFCTASVVTKSVDMEDSKDEDFCTASVVTKSVDIEDSKDEDFCTASVVTKSVDIEDSKDEDFCTASVVTKSVDIEDSKDEGFCTESVVGESFDTTGAPATGSKCSSSISSTRPAKNNSKNSFFLKFLSKVEADKCSRKTSTVNEDNKTLAAEEEDNDLTSEEHDNDLASDSDSTSESYKCADVEDDSVNSAKNDNDIENNVTDLLIQSGKDSNSLYGVVMKTNKASQSSCTEDEMPCVSVNELFPDLLNVDQSVLKLLPRDLRKKVEDAIASHSILSHKDNNCTLSKQQQNSLQCKLKLHNDTVTSVKDSTSSLTRRSVNDDSEGNHKICNSCNVLVPANEYQQHQDYHFAVKLRQEQLEEAKHQITAKSQSKISPHKKIKRKRKSDNKIPCKNSRIDSYFHKK